MSALFKSREKEKGDGNKTQVMGPVTVKERIPVIDVLRGVAILGILVINMEWYAFPEGYTQVYLKMFNSIGDQIAFWFTQFFGKGKFVSMLSFLLGLGTAVQVTRALEKGKKFSFLYSRRMLGLLAIGVVHDLLLWRGVILPLYAVMGFFLLLFQRRQPKTLITWAVIFFLIPILFTTVYVGLMPQPQTSTQEQTEAERTDKQKQALEEQKQKSTEIIEVFRNGSYWDMMLHRLNKLKQTVMIIITGGWRTLAFFLLGIWAWQKGFFHDIEGNLKFLRRTRWITLGLGLAGTAVYFILAYIYLAGPRPSSPVIITGLTVQFIGRLGLCLFYITAIILLTRKQWWRKFLKPLEAVGRMAFSNYVFQTLVFTAFFYGYGFKMFGRTGPLVNFFLMFPVFALQIYLSVWWSKRFRFGPLEWLWRSMTYGKRQPMRLREKG